MWCVHTMGYYLALKKIVAHAVTWMNLEVKWWFPGAEEEGEMGSCLMDIELKFGKMKKF